MGGFVPLPSPYNPYVQQAGEYARGASSIAAAQISAKNAAIRQAQTLQQQYATQQGVQQQRDIQNSFDIARLGGISATVRQPAMHQAMNTGRGAPGPPTPLLDPNGDPVMTEVENPDIQGKFGGEGSYIRDATGANYFIPSEAAKKRYEAKSSLNDSNSVVINRNSPFWPQAQELGVPEGTRVSTQNLKTWGELHEGLTKEAEKQAQKNSVSRGEPYDLREGVDQNGNPAYIAFGRNTGRSWLEGVPDASTGAAPVQQSGGTPGSAFDMRNWQQYVNQGQDWRGPDVTGNVPPLQTQQPGAQTPAAPAQAGGGVTFRPKKAAAPRENVEDWIRIKNDPASTPAEVKRVTANIADYRASGTEADKDRHEARVEAEADRAQRTQERADDRAEKQAEKLNSIEDAKKKSNKAAIDNYRAAIDKGVDQKVALSRLRSDLDANQGDYEGNIGRLTKQQIPHQNLYQNYDPDAPGGRSGPRTNPFRSPNVNPFAR